ADPAAPYGVPQALRTGASSLIGKVSDDLLARNPTDPEHLDLIHQLGLHSAIIVPLVARGRTLGALTFATADSGRHYNEADLELGRPLELEYRRVDLVTLARQRIAEHQQQTQRHLIQQAGEPYLLGEWDGARLERVLDNLLSNAIKYSPEGGIIRVAVVHDEDE